MITVDQLERLYKRKGKKLFTYLKNKNKGGTNNAKGNSFENHFALYAIADHFNKKSDHRNTHFSAQLLCFIDDLIVKNETDHTAAYYQIKDIQRLSWNGNPHAIADDFRMQYTVCSDNGESVRLGLVLSSTRLKNDLEANMPADLNGIVDIRQFTKANSISTLLQTNDAVRDALTNMCALNRPTKDKLETLGTILLGAWSGSTQNQVTLEALLDSCYQQNPHYIKGFDNRISPALREILEGIADFSYEAENGYLKWRYQDTDDGVVSYQIGTRAYIDWENEVIHSNASDFEQLESFLV